jgi:glyoxylase-like metal-dependent hydrolase (beta-lactamase superfamily II)/rhodanese-related sulfurtransferase
VVFEQLNDGSCRTYLVADQGEAALVDPVLGREDHYLGVLRERGLTLRFAFDTHTHADHLSGCALLRDRTGADHGVFATSRISEGNLRLEDGQRLMVGAEPVDIMHTPGHTQDSMSLRLSGRLLTGDFLFLGEGGAGRTDLPGGDPAAHWESLQKLQNLDGGLLVFPGHDYRGRTHSSLAEERHANPRLQPRTKASYVTWLEGLRLPPADWMKAVVLANLSCSRDPGCVAIPDGGAVCEVSAGCATVPQISCEELLASMESPLLLDVRQPEEYRGPLGHIRGARLLPLGELPRRLDELEDYRHHPVVTACQMGGRSNQAAAILIEAGFRRVCSLAGGMMRWNILGYPAER